MQRFTRLLRLFTVVTSLFVSQVFAFQGLENVSRLQNITRTVETMEINPTFVNAGQQIVFLVFDGDELNPQMWDYHLSLSDRFGNHLERLTPKGVVEYVVDRDTNKIRFLIIAPEGQPEPTEKQFFQDLTKWKLMEIAPVSRKVTVIETANGRSLEQGLKRLHVAKLFDNEHEKLCFSSPFGKEQIVVQRSLEHGKVVVHFIKLNENGQSQRIFTSDSWKTYSHFGWYPSVQWLDAEHILTMVYHDLGNPNIPKNFGLFSIIKINLLTKKVDLVFQSMDIYPFTQLNLYPFTEEIVFQIAGREGSYRELWSLNLETGLTEKLYWVKGDIGSVNVSSDGASMVFTQLLDNNFDIVRLDLRKNNQLRFAQN